jgi:hypothetical protein
MVPELGWVLWGCWGFRRGVRGWGGSASAPRLSAAPLAPPAAAPASRRWPWGGPAPAMSLAAGTRQPLTSFALRCPWACSACRRPPPAPKSSLTPPPTRPTSCAFRCPWACRSLTSPLPPPAAAPAARRRPGGPPHLVRTSLSMGLPVLVSTTVDLVRLGRDWGGGVGGQHQEVAGSGWGGTRQRAAAGGGRPASAVGPLGRPLLMLPPPGRPPPTSARPRSEPHRPKARPQAHAPAAAAPCAPGGRTPPPTGSF